MNMMMLLRFSRIHSNSRVEQKERLDAARFAFDMKMKIASVFHERYKNGWATPSNLSSPAFCSLTAIQPTLS
jgi:hypothetical protein